MKLSIITINLNNAEGLQNTFNSVFSQTEKAFEYIVIDGDSYDGSKELILKNSNAITKHLIEKDSGIYNAMNKGIRLAHGEYLLFLNSGDYFESKETLSSVIHQLNNADIVYGNMVIDTKGKLTYANSPASLQFEEMIYGTLWHPVSFIKKELFDKYGLYNEKYKIIADYEFFLRTIFVEGVSVKHINTFIAVFNTEGIGSSNEFKELQVKERYEAQSKLFHPKIIESALLHAKLKRSKPQVVYNFIKTKPLLLRLAKMVYAIVKSLS